MAAVEVLAQRDRLGEAHVDASELARARCADLAHQEDEALGLLLVAQVLAHVLGQLEDLVVGDRDRHEQHVADVVLARAVDDVVQDPVARRQELPRARAPALDEELLVEAPLHQHGDEARAATPCRSGRRRSCGAGSTRRCPGRIRFIGKNDMLMPAAVCGGGKPDSASSEYSDRWSKLLLCDGMNTSDARRPSSRSLSSSPAIDVDLGSIGERVHPAREAPEDLHREQVVTRAELAQRALAARERLVARQARASRPRRRRGPGSSARAMICSTSRRGTL